MRSAKHTNRLINATSPYLLQHAHNPVDWYEWGSDALQKAKAEDKPILVSIGYSSCHWCHVMERECFENDNIAQVMNQHFVCIKVDREERPDVDQLYMDAVQAMNINGGWPLHVFLTADQKPFYGGTYFAPQNWVHLLTNIHHTYQIRRGEIEASAAELTKHLSRNDTDRFKQKSATHNFNADLEAIFEKLHQRFDTTWGGLDRVPKFVMPSLWHWLLRYYTLTKNESAIRQVMLTLKRIAMGGIYDQLGGGFARYSVDGEWFAPHFEKMLYDNAQLLSVYAEAFALTKDQEFKVVINETFSWLAREMTNEQGGFYSALDADSDGVEGKFYVWTKDEIDRLPGVDAPLLAAYYDVQKEGNWEHGTNILVRKNSDEAFLNNHNLNKSEWLLQLNSVKKKLLAIRETRTPPGLDDKVITAWNAMMVTGLVDCYHALKDDKFLLAAIKNMKFILHYLADGVHLFRSYKGKRSAVTGFLDDYAFVIQANVKLYEATFDEAYLTTAKRLAEETMRKFYDQHDGYFQYTAVDAEKLIASRKEIFDNVIPSSNSIMARNLFHLGTLYDHQPWVSIATEMVTSLAQLIKTEPNYMSNWAIAYTEIKKGLAEVAIVGADAHKLKTDFKEHFQPFTLVLGAVGNSNLPLLEGKMTSENTTTMFVCYNKVCQRPVYTVAEALTQLV